MLGGYCIRSYTFNRSVNRDDPELVSVTSFKEKPGPSAEAGAVLSLIDDSMGDVIDCNSGDAPELSGGGVLWLCGVIGKFRFVRLNRSSNSFVPFVFAVNDVPKKSDFRKESNVDLFVGDGRD